MRWKLEARGSFWRLLGRARWDRSRLLAGSMALRSGRGDLVSGSCPPVVSGQAMKGETYLVRSVA
jgi:hypothetical protein